MVEPLINKTDFVVDWFRVKADETANDAVKRSQQQAVDSFCCFPGGTSIKFGDITEELLSEWVSWMFCQGYSYGTVLTYTERLSALYGRAVKEGFVVDNGCFATVKRRLKSISSTSLEIHSLPDLFNKLRKLVLADYSKNPALQLARDLVLFSLYNGGLSFDRLAGYRKDDYEGCDESVIRIIERYAKAKNKYLFPLNQSARTPKQLKISISSLFADAMKAVGISLSSYEEGLPTELWALIAMRCGIAPSEIAGCINEVNKVSPVYSFVKRTELTEERKEAIRSHVTRILSKNPEDWYAMQFRSHVSYERVKERMRSAGIAFSKSFYPMEEIVRRIDKKLVRESRPVIPGLLFFKRRATELPELYFHIGDLAWGYRYGRGSDSSYAIIPQKAIEDYERAIGKFVDGMDAYPEGMFHFEAGDKVEITGGAFSGQPAVFEKEVHEIDKGTHQTVKLTYRLRLEGMQNCAWVVELDPRQMSKITDERFESLRNKIHTVVDSND